MSRTFDAYYFSPAYNAKEASINARKEADINAEWELHEAGEDLARGIQENPPLEFVYFDNK